MSAMEESLPQNDAHGFIDIELIVNPSEFMNFKDSFNTGKSNIEKVNVCYGFAHILISRVPDTEACRNIIYNNSEILHSIFSRVTCEAGQFSTEPSQFLGKYCFLPCTLSDALLSCIIDMCSTLKFQRSPEFRMIIANCERNLAVLDRQHFSIVGLAAVINSQPFGTISHDYRDFSTRKAMFYHLIDEEWSYQEFTSSTAIIDRDQPAIVSRTFPNQRKLNSNMSVLLLAHHTQMVSAVRFNEDGDLLFTCSADKSAAMFRTDTGEFIREFKSVGAVNDIDPSWDSRYLAMATAGRRLAVFDIATGETCAELDQGVPCRSCHWSEGGVNLMVSRLRFTGHPPKIVIYRFNRETYELLPLSEFEVACDGLTDVTTVRWTLMDESILVTLTDGSIRMYDQRGHVVRQAKIHSEKIRSLEADKYKGFFITASEDHSAKLIDASNLQVLKTYKSDRMVCAASISPSHRHIILAGGEDPQVAANKQGVGKFEICFYHQVFEEEFGKVKGHFGQVQSLAFHPSGAMFASAAYDGMVRLHKFDDEYLFMDDGLEVMDETSTFN